MKRPQNFDELLNIAKNRPDVHGALSQLGISLKRVGHSMGGVRWQTETKSGTSGDLSAIAFIEKSDGSWIIFDNKGRIGQQSMDAITCLREIFGVSFDDAVYMLSGGAPSAPVAKPQKLTLERKAEPREERTYTPPTPAPDKLRNVKAYLIQTRKLPKELVLPLIESGKIYATERFKSKTAFCTFPITDENGNNVGTDMAATIDDLPKEYKKHLEKGSNADYAWCFPYEVEDITSETPIFFCEAPIDTMSLCALSGTPGIYVSMAGCKDRTFTSVAEKLGGTPIICVDNDETGDAFAARHPDVTRMVAPYGKDWNDTLKYYVENNLSYAYSAPDAEAAPDVPLEDNVGGHVVHLDNEVIDPKKENGALDKGASEENEYLKAVSELETISDEAYLKARSEDPFILVSEHTPSVILNTLENGKDRQILIRRDALYLALRESGVQEGNYHGLGKETLLNLPKYLEDPDVILSTEKNNEERRLLLTSIPSKNGQGIISIEFETTKEFKGQNKQFNLIVTMFDLHQNYLKGQFKKFNAQIRYKKENLAQVNPQLLEWLRTFNARSSINSIPENPENVNTSDEKNSNLLYDKDPPIADNVGKQSQDELRATLEAKVKDVIENYRTDPRALAEYVIFCSKFNDYSANNLRLIWAQYPNAQFVTSAYDFSHGLPDKDGKPTISEKIFIKKGEHALRIWKPYDVKYTVMPDGTEKRSAWLTKSERELAKAEKWKELKRTFFTLVPVFDITQTTASPDVYPKICGLGGIADATSEKIFKGISDYCKYELNCPVIVRDFGERKATVRGLYYPDCNEIHISDMLEGENKRSTALHEAGHAILRLYNYLNQNDSVALSELKADMIAIMLESAVGIKPTDARCEHLKAHYDKYLAERNVSDISADDEVFNDVIKICREQMPTIIEYINNSMLTQAQSTEQTETQSNAAHITPKRTM